jgi:hypothetical protein
MIFCNYPDCENFKEGRTDYCASHNHQMRKEEKELLKPKKQPHSIANRSEKGKKEDSEYTKEKREFIKGKSCAVFPNLKAQDVHHKAGRTGYIDQWARDNGITALRDQRYWLPVSRKAHVLIELKPNWAKDKGFSVDRLSKK